MSFNLKDMEKQFHADGYRLAMSAVESGWSKETLLKAVFQLHRMVDELIDSFTVFAEKQNQQPACKKKCYWCCYQPVFALSYELDFLNDYVEKNFDPPTRKRIDERAAEKRRKLNGVHGEALYRSKSPCPLLENGECMAYSARPVACRIYLSSNVASCLKYFHEPENAKAVPALLYFPLRMGRMINEGFKAALKANGLDVDEFRIEEKIGTGIFLD